MKRPAPIYASERTAAQLLDMRPEALRKLVAEGHLPAPVRIGPHERFDMVALVDLLRGARIEAAGGMEW